MMIYTIGHSTHPIADFLAMLESFKITMLADVRTIPKSRHNPQFGQEELSRSLQDAGITYLYMKDLGGLRKARPDSPNSGWRNTSFRGYADYMQTEDFSRALDQLIGVAKAEKVAIMCAEAVPWRCHRSLVADALLVHGIAVEHIMGTGKSSPHKLTSFAEIRGQSILYPPETRELPLNG